MNANAETIQHMHIFFLSRFSAEPWTLFLPVNSGLPGPGFDGFLSDKSVTKRMLLNHAVLGAALKPTDLLSSHVTTITGTKLTFSQEQGMRSTMVFFKCLDS